MALYQTVQAAIDAYGLIPSGESVVVGVSGGPDSLFLLRVLCELAPSYGATVHAGHLNHGIRPEAAEEAAYVAELCQAWGVDCTVATGDIPARAAAQGLSLEEAARQARYAFLGRLARDLGGRTVAVGHHADDQVETVLMHLLRGSGLAGLRGMRPLARLDELHLGLAPDEAARALGGVLLIRPLLDVTRVEIEGYCRDHGLEPLYDRSNLDTTLFRNRIRHELLPSLESYNPNIRAVLRRMADALAGDYEVLRGMLAEAWPAVVRSESAERIILDLAALRALPLGLQRSVLREAAHRLRWSLRDIAFENVAGALGIVAQGRVGARALLPGGLTLTLGYDAALLAPDGVGWPPEDRPRVDAPVAVALPGDMGLPDGRWRLVAREIRLEALPQGWQENVDSYTAFFDAERLSEPLSLRPRQTGDVLVPLGLGRRQSVKELLINAKVPRPERDGVPLLVCGGQVAWVVGVRVDARFAVTADTRRVYWLQFERIERNEA